MTVLIIVGYVAVWIATYAAIILWRVSANKGRYNDSDDVLFALVWPVAWVFWIVKVIVGAFGLLGDWIERGYRDRKRRREREEYDRRRAQARELERRQAHVGWTSGPESGPDL